MRRPAPDDAAAMAAVLRQAFAEYEPLYTPAGCAATTPTGARIAQRLGEGPVWIALLDGAIVGTVSPVPRGEALYIRSTAVLPAARGQEIRDCCWSM